MSKPTPPTAESTESEQDKPAGASAAENKPTNDDAAASTDAGAKPDADAADSTQDPAERIAELEDKLIRVQADAANSIKRAAEHNEKMAAHAAESFAGRFFEVADNLERALENNTDAQANTAKVIEGVALTLSSLNSIFSALGIEAIEPEQGAKSDPNLHQAILMEESSTVSAGCIVRSIQKGYRMNQRLLRPARVIVAKQPAAKSAAGEDKKDSPAEGANDTQPPNQEQQ